MYIHILSCCCRLSGVVYLLLRVTPYFPPRVTPYFFHEGPHFFFSGGEPPGDRAGVIPSLSLEGTSSHTWVWGYGFYAKDSDQWCQLQLGARCRVANSRNITAAKSILFTYVPGAGICNEICMVFKLVV